MSGLAFGWFFVLLEGFFHCNSLELSFLFSLLQFDGFMLSKVLNIFRVVVGFIGLCFWCRVEFLCSLVSIRLGVTRRPNLPS
jgi:hypothetical protein